MISSQQQTGKNNHKKVSNQLDKICSKLQISVKDINNDNSLSKSVKLKIQKYIQKDDIQKLQEYLDKKILDYSVQIGIQTMKWNILHFAIKNNSIKILKVILPKTYQQSQQKYTALINSKTLQGYTPLMISIIYSSKDSFLQLLTYGGIKIQQKDNKNLTAYDLALNYKNEFAIRQLMSKSNKQNQQTISLNNELLSKPIDSNLYSSNLTCYTKVFQCFVDFFICFNKNLNEDQQFYKQPSNQIQKLQNQNFLRKSFNGSKFMSYLNYNQDNGNKLDIVNIGNQQIQAKYSIQWRKLSKSANQKPVLFDCFQPFDINQNNLIIANNLIIFQCLSDHTWLVRKILKPLKKIDNQTSNNSQTPLQYTVQIYLNDQIKRITIDQHIPFLKQRQQPMFLSNLNEMWPQILQKGLAKIYGSYMSLSTIKPVTFIESLTGSYTQQYHLIEGNNYLKQPSGQFIKQKQIMSALQDFSAKGYLILLQGRQGTSLSPKNSPSNFKTYCYTVLNFYQKGNKKLILVNCPYILNSWKQKQKSQITQLKLIKSHYNTHNQMCVWIQENQFAHFFKSMIISFAQSNVNRSQLKIRYQIEDKQQVIQKRPSQKLSILQNITNSAKKIFSGKNIKHQQNNKTLLNPLKKLIFIKFNIENSKNSQICSIAVKDHTSHQFCKINKFKGWINGGFQISSQQQSNPFTLDLIKINQKKGEYLCMIEIQLPKTIQSNKRQSVTSKTSQKSFIQYNNQNDDKENKNNQNRVLNKRKQQKQKVGQNGSVSSIKKTKKQEFLVICWAQDVIQLENIQQEFAMIQWVDSWRKFYIKNWTFQQKKLIKPAFQEYQLKYLCQKIGRRLIFMIKSSKNLTLSFNILEKEQFNQKSSRCIQQGNLINVQQIKSENINSSNQNSQQKLVQYSLTVSLIRDSQHEQYQYVVFRQNQAIQKIMLQNLYFTIIQENNTSISRT